VLLSSLHGATARRLTTKDADQAAPEKRSKTGPEKIISGGVSGWPSQLSAA
jgi:hypothetical protein